MTNTKNKNAIQNKLEDEFRYAENRKKSYAFGFVGIYIPIANKINLQMPIIMQIAVDFMEK